MNPHPHDSEQRWSGLIARARADQPPTLDVNSLLARLHEAQPAPDVNWLVELSVLLESRRCFATCAVGAVAIAAVGSWQVLTWIEALEWIGWAYPAAGGVL